MRMLTLEIMLRVVFESNGGASEADPLAAWDYVPVEITIAAGVGEAGNSIAYVRRHSLSVDGRPRTATTV